MNVIKKSDVTTVEIFFSDLKEESKKDLLEVVGINDPKEANWDIDMAPLAIIGFDETAINENKDEEN